MINIADFFKKIQNKHSQELFIRSTIQTCVKKFTQVDLPIEFISIKNSVVSVKNISQTAKSQIFIKKKAILEEINLQQKNKIITDIR